MHSIMTAMEAKQEEEEALIVSLEELRVGAKEREEETGLKTESLPSLAEVEEILGYKFNNESLLEEAFTDGSFKETCLTYERLEYVGDSVLNILISKEQFFLYPDLPPGSLTRLRAANVDSEKLARVAIKHGLHKYLRHKKPLLEQQILEFTESILDYPLHSNGLVNTPKVLADIVESTIGAVFIDCNFSLDTVWKVFRCLLEPIITPETLGRNPVSELFELCQKKGWRLQFVTDPWKDNKTVDVFVEDILMGKAIYGLKKEIAANRAAKDALGNIGSKLGEKDATDIDGSMN